MQGLKGKTVIVTGSGGSIGSAMCLRFARTGAAVGVLDLNPEAGERVAAQIRDEGGSALAVRCDITDGASVDAAVAAVEQELDPRSRHTPCQ